MNYDGDKLRVNAAAYEQMRSENYSNKSSNNYKNILNHIIKDARRCTCD